MMSAEEQKIIKALQENWIWVPNWTDSSDETTAGKIVHFTRNVHVSSQPIRSLLHFSADTRYKLYVNGKHVAVGPTRSSPLIWYYDTLDIAPYLNEGQNEIRFVVIRYFAASRSAMPFERTARPGLTVIGHIEASKEVIELASSKDWMAYVDESIKFPMGLPDDVFLHISERITPTKPSPAVTPFAYNIKTLNGDVPPWHLRPRSIPMPEQTPAVVNIIRACNSAVNTSNWTAFFSKNCSPTLPANSIHSLEVQADFHSTAFLRWVFKAVRKPSQARLKVTHSEGYELEPRSYPFFRSKADRLDASVGHIVGPYDEVTLDLPNTESVIYEPFWFRTFRLLRIEITVGSEPVELVSFDATQVNYPMGVKASWNEPGDVHSERIWDVSIRTMRNCMFDGYSDCPFYEQLQYSGDSRSVGLFHYLLSGDDRLMRQAITNFAASVTPNGLTQSRFPAHVPQVIAGFSLYWILQVCDHHLYFGDTRFARGFIPRIDGILDFFDAHIDDLGLVSGLPQIVWQYVDWVTTWGATDDHPDKGVPMSGRKSNRHTYFSMIYAWTLQKVACLVRDLGRPGHAAEYEARAVSLVDAIRAHCYDGQFFTDSTADVADELSYSQHCQIFAVISGAASSDDSVRILTQSFKSDRFSKCSYMMRFYAFRALTLAGEDIYESFWESMWAPWRKMLANNLSTWEEDDVRQRSDCHAWGSVPIYEYCTEVAGVQPIAAGSAKIFFKPRLRLTQALEAKVALGRDNLATVSWKSGSDNEKIVELRLEKPVEVVSQFPGAKRQEHGVVDHLSFVFKG
ncbi:Bacterial alpha-L-rhamnosidase [Penicillium canariense]|uniref:Bacterial alpha-L-rhamnosidase n=1 Tax=Penicillium canariense TaxID=189055 RepID=A0A9W9IFE1_9EURO|nr:Bacterial alpha-L-rhamnosidase [Penicillium canariense]KAJ5174586.1 Bacterial alpha-L-rhamnosidase [Penicillium canariense]